MTASSTKNKTLLVTSPGVSFLPDICDSRHSPCQNATWTIVNDVNSTAGLVAVTRGPQSTVGSLAPQVFADLQGLAVTLITGRNSNGIVNLTLASGSESLFNGQANTTTASSRGVAWSLTGLDQTRRFTLGLTSVSQGDFALVVDSVVVTQPNPGVAPAPALSLGLSSSTKSFTDLPTPSLSGSALSKKDNKSGVIAASVLGGFLGLSAFVLLVVLLYIRRRRFTPPKSVSPPPESITSSELRAWRRTERPGYSLTV